MALFAISRKAVDEEYQKIPKNDCFMNLDICDWDLQRSVCMKIKEDLQAGDKEGNLVAGKANQKQSKPLQFLFGSGLGVTSPKVLPGN